MQREIRIMYAKGGTDEVAKLLDGERGGTRVGREGHGESGARTKVGGNECIDKGEERKMVVVGEKDGGRAVEGVPGAT